MFKISKLIINIKKSIKRRLKYIKKYITLYKVRYYQKRALSKIQKKKQIKVAFLLVNEAMWKYDYLYYYLEKDSRFKPIIFICPFVTYGEEVMNQEMHNSYENFRKKGYTVIKTIKDNGELLNIKEEFKPELIFFSTPWSHTYKEYLINNYYKYLTAYVSYSYISKKIPLNYDRPLHNYCWRYFLESFHHKDLAKRFSINKGKNTIVTGFPGTDNLINEKYQKIDVWKKQKIRKKKLIWAPHHTIKGAKNSNDYSTFLDYADFMLKIAEDYKDKIQLSFKPHPNLKGKLISIWGKEKTKTYYNKWENMSNTQLEQGQYIDLFLTSDAMIHDSGSFILEYLVTKKPVMYLMDKEGNINNKLNEVGKKAFDKMYLGYNKKEIESFINKVVLQEQDPKDKERKEFFEEYLKPPNNKLASENIYEYLLSQFKLN